MPIDLTTKDQQPKTNNHGQHRDKKRESQETSRGEAFPSDKMGNRHNNNNFHTADCGGITAPLPIFHRGDYPQPYILILHHL